MDKQLVDANMKFVYVHMDGCFKPAFYMDHKPAKGEPTRIAGVRLLDGSKPTAGMNPVCGSCGGPIFLLNINHVKEIP